MSSLSIIHILLFKICQGDAIQILGQRTNQGYIESVLNLSNCYTISEYTCPRLDDYQKVLENDIYMDVGIASVIQPIPDTITIPSAWFRFVSKTQLMEFGENPPFCPGTHTYYYKGNKIAI